MALNGAASFPQACEALSSMLSRNALNPADISVLFRNYNLPEPPPIDLIRTPQFLGKSITYANGKFAGHPSPSTRRWHLVMNLIIK